MTNSSRRHYLVDELEETIDDVYGWNAYRPIDIFPEGNNSFFDREGGMHEFTDDEYTWTPLGWDENMKFQRINRQ